MAIAGIYKRILPSPPAIDFSSFQGKKLFSEALQSGNMEGFFNLISYFQTQSEPAYCGLASLSMVLNALGIDSRKKWKGPWRWFDESMLDCCEPLEKIKNEGITFGKVACLAHCAGARVEAFHSDQSTIDDFRKYVKACTSSDDCHLITSYHRAAFNQTGSGHFSPVGGYHAETDMALILDVARFKYPPHWVPLALLWEAMETVDESTGHHRGFMLISRLQAPSLLYTLSCKHESWMSIVKYLMDDVPSLVKSEDVRNVEKVLSVVFTSLPTSFTEFIKWVAEARRQEDGALSKEDKGRLSVKEEVLKQMRETGLFKRVQEWISSVNICCRSISSLGDKDALPEIAACFCCQVAGNPGSSHGCLCSISCVKCLKVNGNVTPITMVSGTVVTHESEQAVENLVPFSQLKSNCCGANPSTCTGMLHPASNDILTALLLALPPKTWSGIIEEKISQEICSLLATEHLPSLLQEAVLHLRRQLHFLKKCQEKKSNDRLGEPTTH